MLKKVGSNNTNKFNPQERGKPEIHGRSVQIIQINSILKNLHSIIEFHCLCSNNTNKFNPQELFFPLFKFSFGSNNTNKFNPQELVVTNSIPGLGSNNTNKFNPQEHYG